MVLEEGRHYRGLEEDRRLTTEELAMGRRCCVIGQWLLCFKRG